MDHEGTLHFVRTGEGQYSVSFTPNDASRGESEAQRSFVTENDLEEFLLDAGFGAQHSDGIQGALHSVGHHTVDDRRISDRQWRRMFEHPSGHGTRGSLRFTESA